MLEEVRSPKIFYGWFVVAACFAATFTLGEAMWSFGVFFKPLEREFGWSRAMISSCYTAFIFGFAISIMTSGRLSDRYSPRPILFVSSLLAGIGVSLCSSVHSINQLRVFLFIGGLGGGATFSVPTSVVQRWFYRRPRAGLALGIVVAGVGAGALFFTPLVNYLIMNYGWRKTYLIIGILFFATIMLSSLVIKRAPVETKLCPENRKIVQKPISAQDLTTRQIVMTPSFVGITFMHCSASFAFNNISVHLIPYTTDIGISSTVSALALGLMGGFSVPGRIISGFIADRLGWQRIIAASLYGMALFILWLLFVRASWMLLCFVLFYGICHGSRVSAHVGILGDFFGMRSLGEVIGITMATGQIIGGFAPYLAGFIFDITGSYLIAFTVVMALLMGGGIIAQVMKKPVQREWHA